MIVNEGTCLQDTDAMQRPKSVCGVIWRKWDDMKDMHALGQDGDTDTSRGTRTTHDSMIKLTTWSDQGRSEERAWAGGQRGSRTYEQRRRECTMEAGVGIVVRSRPGRTSHRASERIR